MAIHTQRAMVVVVWPIVFVSYRRPPGTAPETASEAQRQRDRQKEQQPTQPPALEVALHRCMGTALPHWQAKVPPRAGEGDSDMAHTVYGAGGSVSNQKLCQNPEVTVAQWPGH